MSPIIIALALAAAAQEGERNVTTSRNAPETVKIAVSGDLELDYVYRGAEITAFTEAVTPAAPFDATDGENTFEGHAAVRFDVTMSDNISVVVEVGTRRVDDDAIKEWGNPTAEDILVREARLKFGEVLMQELSAEIGLTTWSFDVRGRGSAFAFDPRHSQSIARGTVVGSGPTREEIGTALGLRAGFPEELEAMGLWLSYARESLVFDIVALPAVLEGGAASDDEALYAVDFWYKLDMLGKGSQVGALFAVSSAAGRNTGVKTFGGGAVVKGLSGMDGLEVYAEAYFQSGSAGQADVDRDGLVDNDVDAGGTAWQVGAEYRAPGDMNLWLGTNFTLISGDGDDDATSSDDQVDRFLGYENVNDLMILEDMYFGFDWDSNYEAFKISGGLSLSVAGGKNNLEISAILGMAKTAEDVDFAGAGENKLGNEIDVKVRLLLGKQASLRLGAAYLTGSDILEQSMGGAANQDAEDSALLYVIGADVRF